MPRATATSHDHSTTMPSRRRRSIKQFDGARNSNDDWDGLRKDSELWFEDGDCAVHLYTLGGSQRGPSLRLKYADVDALRCDYLTEQCLYSRDSSSPISSDDGASDSGYASSHTTKAAGEQYELYIPAPADAKRGQAYTYHLTTRNFFAYATRKPVVGERLGSALSDLLERMREWLPKTAALANFTNYCEEQGYSNMAGNVDYALACLALAKHARLKDLWVESFVHCVGMFEKLHLSPDFECLSNTTKALITRATLEMDLHIARVTRAVGSLLEEELGPENLGLSKPARDHLDRFRSFLHKYYVTKLGYFPPNQEGPWNKRLWTKMYHAFQTLYEYLVDADSSFDRLNDRGATGGICVVQNVQAFNRRHGYTPLPHPLPLLPQAPIRRRTIDAQKGLRSLVLGRVDSAAAQHLSSKQGLAKAANVGVQETTACELVEAYQQFERQYLEEKLTVPEARKVRWLLIYGALQMLISITRAPKEVRDTETPTYPLCVLTTGSPSWMDEASHEKLRAAPLLKQDSAAVLLPPVDDEAEPEGRLSIHPDCEAENAEDYFSSGNTMSRRASELSFDLTPSALRINTQVSRTASIRSSVHSGVHALQRSFMGSMSRRNSLRRTATRPISRVESGTFCEILVEGYGNGSVTGDTPSRQQSMLSLTELQREESASLAGFDFGLTEVNEEPVLEDCQVDSLLHDSAQLDDMLWMGSGLTRIPSDTSLSTPSTETPSTRSSTYTAAYDSPATDFSSPWDDSDESKRNSEIHEDTNTACDPDVAAAIAARPSTPTKHHSYQHRDLTFGTNLSALRTRDSTVTAGCYTPTGSSSSIICLPTTSKFCEQRGQSVASSDAASEASSEASSMYPEGEGSLQAGEIEEEESRGRRRVRALDRVGVGEMESEGRGICVGG
ncbi:hypothetical protein LTR91_024777 [Friedmanniomyces endolithicus]|uniref:DUF8004 domain-containing protein n=1 Tax=Friedmanniomyces endolithicus TaxID=329885 RepID=A0AAN6K035_9PEZI|nr:hypothetical protein LTR57_012075 [Friedmanniomyces endolithicus]KAK0951794.1 hypothetical protein LTR91_024777 [Friedmanniomyces endolithicus]KAK0974413.1 hypothetical protein LTS01_014182 [Friedmanniomyces endolithicus]KAK1047402.1 hypothetical protein LTS16_005172 [Friedmanniomyces endolithicus]